MVAAVDFIIRRGNLTTCDDGGWELRYREQFNLQNFDDKFYLQYSKEVV